MLIAPSAGNQPRNFVFIYPDYDDQLTVKPAKTLHALFAVRLRRVFFRQYLMVEYAVQLGKVDAVIFEVL
jgi:hypothetical protein